MHFKFIQKHLNVTGVRSQWFWYERQSGGWHTQTRCWSGFGVQRYDRLDDTALTNVDNSKRLPGESHDQQWLVLIWVTWSQGPQKWAAVTFPLGTRAVWGGTADAAVCAVQLFFIYLLQEKKIYICAASSAFTAFSATSSLIPSSRDLSEPLEASGPEEPPVSASLQFGQFSIRRSPLKKQTFAFHIWLTLWMAACIIEL